MFLMHLYICFVRSPSHFEAEKGSDIDISVILNEHFKNPFYFVLGLILLALHRINKGSNCNGDHNYSCERKYLMGKKATTLVGGMMRYFCRFVALFLRFPVC